MTEQTTLTAMRIVFKNVKTPFVISVIENEIKEVKKQILENNLIFFMNGTYYVDNNYAWEAYSDTAFNASKEEEQEYTKRREEQDKAQALIYELNMLNSAYCELIN